MRQGFMKHFRGKWPVQRHFSFWGGCIPLPPGCAFEYLETLNSIEKSIAGQTQWTDAGSNFRPLLTAIITPCKSLSLSFLSESPSKTLQSYSYSMCEYLAQTMSCIYWWFVCILLGIRYLNVPLGNRGFWVIIVISITLYRHFDYHRA